MELKDIIKNRRLELGLTLLDVANKCNVAEGTVSRWESGDIANIRKDKLPLLAKALNLSISTRHTVLAEEIDEEFLKKNSVILCQEIIKICKKDIDVLINKNIPYEIAQQIFNETYIFSFESLKSLSSILEQDLYNFITEAKNTSSFDAVKDEDLKFALFNGTKGITDEMLEEVKKFAEMVKLREATKKEKNE